MELRRRVLQATALTLIVCGLTTEAMAQFGDLQQRLFNDFFYAGNHTFISNPQGGPLFDNNIFDQRIEWNKTGQGWTYEQFRFFGTDSFNNPNTLDLGPLKIQLGADPGILQNPQPVGMHNRAGYTTTLIPEVFFESQTGQRNFNQFSGQTSFTPVPIAYTVNVHTGIQDLEWTGNILVNSRGRMNVMGFYDFEMQVVNVGNMESDGFVVHDEQVTDFDTGPIDVSGNVLFDGIASLLQGLGFAGEAVVPRTLSGASGDLGKSKEVDEILARLQAGEEVSDVEMQLVFQEMILTAIANDPLGFAQNGLPSEIPGFEALTLELAEDQPNAPVNTSVSVPEPGTLVLLACGMAGVRVVHAGRRRRASC